MNRRSAFLRAMVVLTATLSPGFAQQPASPTFRAAINYVELPVRVLDGKGNFVRDLGQGDFQVFEDRQPQMIADFTLVDLPLPVRGATPAPNAPAETVPPPAATNSAPRQIDGRVYLLVFDDYRVRPQYTSQFKRIVTGFVRDHMGAGDVAGVVFTSGANGQDFTGDRRLLIRAIDGFIGRYDGDIPGLDEEQNARATMRTIADISKAMGEIKGRHKAVIYVSATLGCAVSRQVRSDRPPPIFPINPLETNPGSEGEGRPLGASTLLCGEAIWSTVRAAIQSDVSVYAIDPRGVQDPTWVSPKIDGRGGPDRARDKMEMVEGGPPSVFDGMRVLADSTGGFVVANVNGFDKAFDRIARENSSYYLIGYYSTNEKADGSTRKTLVKLTRKGTQVLYRASYMAPR